MADTGFRLFQKSWQNLDRAKGIIFSLSKALQSLTPGGSEYVTWRPDLDIYIADEKECIGYVRSVYNSGHNAKLKVVDLGRDLDVAKKALSDILNLPKMTLEEASASPELFRKYNQALKIARKANADLAG